MIEILQIRMNGGKTTATHIQPVSKATPTTPATITTTTAANESKKNRIDSKIKRETKNKTNQNDIIYRR